MTGQDFDNPFLGRAERQILYLAKAEPCVTRGTCARSLGHIESPGKKRHVVIRDGKLQTRELLTPVYSCKLRSKRMRTSLYLTRSAAGLQLHFRKLVHASMPLSGRNFPKQAR